MNRPYVTQPRPHSKSDRIQDRRPLLFELEFQMLLTHNLGIEDSSTTDGERRFRIGHPKRGETFQFRKKLEGQGRRFHLRVHLKTREEILRFQGVMRNRLKGLTEAG